MMDLSRDNVPLRTRLVLQLTDDLCAGPWWTLSSSDRRRHRSAHPASAAQSQVQCFGSGSRVLKKRLKMLKSPQKLRIYEVNF